MGTNRGPGRRAGWRWAGLAACLLLLACVWDSDTLRDELQRKPGTFDLVSGQFQHHGKPYYEHRVRRLDAEIPEHPDDVVRRNDRAVALLKLGRYEDSLAEFKRIEEIAPGRYETLSNLGVLHKKMGEFGKAAEYLEKALALKPEGHMGVGDYYVKMVKYLEEAKSGIPPDRSFLGYPYGDFFVLRGPAHSEFWEHRGRVETRMPKLIEADASFADGMLVLGDLFCGNRDLNLALWAYVRAELLGHPNPGAVRKRIDAIFEHWKGASSHKPIDVEDRETTLKAIRSDLALAAQWRTTFEQVEGELVAQKGEIDFDTVMAELSRRGIERFTSPDRGALRTFRASLRADWLLWVAGLSIAAAVTLYIVKYLRDRRLARA